MSELKAAKIKNKVEIVIDGKNIRVDKGNTVLQRVR